MSGARWNEEGRDATSAENKSITGGMELPQGGAKGVDSRRGTLTICDQRNCRETSGKTLFLVFPFFNCIRFLVNHFLASEPIILSSSSWFFLQFDFSPYSEEKSSY